LFITLSLAAVSRVHPFCKKGAHPRRIGDRPV